MVEISTNIYGDDEEMVFGGILSYARSPYSRSLKGVDTAIVGVPFDLASSYRPGSRFAPAAIRKASAQLAWGPLWPWGFKPTEIIKVVDYGDLSFDYARPVTIVKAIEKQISQILSDGTSTLVLGGDHYISYPVLKAYSEFYQDFYVLQFDAHPDLWESGGNDRLDHGIFMYNLIKKI